MTAMHIMVTGDGLTHLGFSTAVRTFCLQRIQVEGERYCPTVGVECEVCIDAFQRMLANGVSFSDAQTPRCAARTLRGKACGRPAFFNGLCPSHQKVYV